MITPEISNALPAIAIAILLFFSTHTSAQIQSERSLMLMYPYENSKGNPWEIVKVEDIAWLLRRTYEIDPQTKGNEVFKNASLVQLMCKDALNGSVKAFGTVTDSFTQILTLNEVRAINDKVQAKPGDSFRIRITEDLIGVKNVKKQYHAILGIAPEMQDSTGVWKPLFWVYYAEMKPDLAVTAVSEKDATIWRTIFDSRNYNARLISSADTVHYSNGIVSSGR